MILRYTPIAALLMTSAFGALVACSSLSDPAKGTANPAPAATTDPPGTQTTKVSGALTAGTTAPSGARVALLWRLPNATVASGSDVVLGADGSLSMDLAAPPDSYLVAADPNQNGYPLYDGLPSAYPPTNSALRVARAGFAIYQDTNGNGKLDITDATTSETSDTIVGTANDYYLTYFASGSDLDYEKMRDKSGVLPHDGYNLTWTGDENSNGIPRWMGLNLIEISVGADMGVSEKVCAGVTFPPIHNADGTLTPIQCTNVPLGDPHIHCASDGRQWYLGPLSPSAQNLNCSTWPGLERPTVCATGCGVGGEILDADAGVPAGWPCLADGGLASP